jgi:hypothetical protein
MTELVENELQAGTFVIRGGLASQADGVRVELSPSGMPQGGAGNCEVRPVVTHCLP